MSSLYCWVGAVLVQSLSSLCLSGWAQHWDINCAVLCSRVCCVGLQLCDSGLPDPDMCLIPEVSGVGGLVL